ncbi:glycosyltransferase family 9 protein [Gayadomonas joobiniege]|uniref:glycosyltransferase family 9 protein n=1 Tax=Gayadomonas joobiniege TaxID=1234606 RepID=UPI00058E0394|nr:glycosyltransferase family 9 protein [Gayadomonas joobiniege]
MLTTIKIALLKIFISLLPKSKSTVYIVKIDALGDYVIFRDWVDEIRSVYPNKKLILVANKALETLVTLDNDFDGYLFIDPKHRSAKQSLALLCAFLRYRASEMSVWMWSPEHFPVLFNLNELSAIKKSRLAFIPSSDKDGFCRQQELKKIFSDVTILSKEVTFESNRYGEFICQSFNRSVADLKMRGFSNASGHTNNNSFYIVLGAGSPKRNWPVHRVAALIDKLHSRENMDLVLLGPKSEEQAAQLLSERFGKRIVNKVGKTDLPHFITELSCASIVVCNESSTPHICARLKVPYVCVSNLNHYLRFHPYPEELKVKQDYLYPVVDVNKLSTDEIKLLQVSSSYYTESITADSVFERVIQYVT